MGFIDNNKKCEITLALFYREHNVKYKYYWLSHQWWISVHPLHSRCIKQLLRHGSELWAVESSTRVYTQLLPQPSRTQLSYSLQPPNDIWIQHTAAGPGICRYNVSDICKRNPYCQHVVFVCKCIITLLRCRLKWYPAFFWAGVPDDSCRSRYGFILAPSGSQSDPTAQLRFVDGCHQAGRGQDAAQRDGQQQSHQAGWRRRHVSAYEWMHVCEYAVVRASYVFQYICYWAPRKGLHVNF